ncbi:MAG: hypothetical protein WHV63_04755 [Ignavibacteria bacterium]
MKNQDNLLIKVAILDQNIFITETIEEILKNYPCEIKKFKDLSDVQEICDYFIFYQESVNDKFIDEIFQLHEFVKRKVLICDKNFSIPTRLLEALQDIINIKELDFLLKELMDYHILIHSDKTAQEQIELVQRLMNDSSHYINSMLVYSEALRNALSKRSGFDPELLIKFEKIIKDFEDEFLSFQNFMFINKIPLQFEDINIFLQRILRERENDFKTKINELKYFPDYTLPMVKINPIALRKIINNLIDIVLLSTKEITSIEISTKNYKKNLSINFSINCSNFDKTLRDQIYNPFFPRSILEYAFVNYFRIKIERLLKMSIQNYFTENKLTFVIRIDFGD